MKAEVLPTPEPSSGINEMDSLLEYGLLISAVVWKSEFEADVAALDKAEVVHQKRKTPLSGEIYQGLIRSLDEKWRVPDEDRLCHEANLEMIGRVREDEIGQLEAKEPVEEDAELLSEVADIADACVKNPQQHLTPLDETENGLDMVAWVDSLFRVSENFFGNHPPECVCIRCAKVKVILNRKKEVAELEEDGFIFSTRVVTDSETVQIQEVPAEPYSEWGEVAQNRFTHPDKELTTPDYAKENPQRLIEDPAHLLTDSLLTNPALSPLDEEARPLEPKDELWLRFFAVKTYGWWIQRQGIGEALEKGLNIQNEADEVLIALERENPKLMRAVFPHAHNHCRCERCVRIQNEQLQNEREMRLQEDAVKNPSDLPKSHTGAPNERF